MNQYVTGAVIKKLREDRKMTQAELAEKISVSDKTISKWETGKGYPDITLLEPLAKALGISMIELLAGQDIRNDNRAANMLRTDFYVCPNCGNIIHTTGKAVISCCGITLPPLEAEAEDEAHAISVEAVEDEWFVSIDHPMEKDHFISFVAGISGDYVQLVKLYPEGNAEARFKRSRVKMIYAYCNHHGFFKKNLLKIK
ncbi:MAG: helix-turn-helix domain-containing protein [Clostridia bacterium]|nr:helix-turn-helix domain-containing protein [Clostridia bacterium]